MKPRIKLGLIIGFFAWLIVLSFAAVHSSGLATRADLSGESAITVPRFMTETSVSPALQLGVDFTFTPTSPTVGQSVTFTASVTGGTPPFSYFWKFSDGVSGSGNPISRAFSLKGTYSVTLNVTDSSSPPLTGSVSHVLTVSPLPLTADFTFSPTVITLGSPVTFTATASGGTTPYTFSWNFGDGTAGTGNPVQHTYSTAGPFILRLNVTDFNGIKASIERPSACITCALVVSVNCPATSSVGIAVSCTASASGGVSPITFGWTAVGGNPSSGIGSSFSTAYSVKGTYVISVTGTDSATPANTATANANVIIAPLLLSITAIVPATGNVGNSVSVSATASGGTTPYAFSWNFGDGTSSVVGSPASHTYASKGTFTVKVNVTDFNSKVASAPSSITINPLSLTSDFSPLSACIGTTITFTGSASGGTAPYSFNWNFGDGTAKVSGNPAFHSYSVKGTYTVTMNVTDFNAATRSITHAFTASGCALVVTPTVPATGTVGTPVSVSAAASGGTSPYFFSWNFGDGTANVAGNTASHTYSVKGTYTVRVNVTDISGRIASASSSITVSPLTLTADFTFSPTVITPGSPVTFTGRAFGGTSPYIFSWNFGDGTAGTGNPVQHTYATSGPFTPRLNVTDFNGAKATNTHIFGGPPVFFISCPATGTTGTAVACTASASGGIPPIIFAWTATGGTPSSGTGSSFSTTYNVKGTYTISVIATDSATPTPNTATASTSITITPLPLAVRFIFSPTSPTAGSPVTFTATSTGGTVPYLFAWRFGDGSTATGNPVTHTYLSTGPFVVTVNVTDANSILATSSRSLSLGPPPPLQADFGPIKTLIGTTTFVSLITGGLPPYTCVWTFGDGTPTTTGCNPHHTYIASGVFTAQVTITDNIGQTTSATHPVTVENNPTFFGSRLHWDRKLALGSSETFSAKMTNPSDLNVTATVTIDVFTDDGIFLAHLTASENLAPGATDTNFPLSFVPTRQGEFLFSATLTYAASLQVTSSTTTAVMGIGGTRTGIFTVF